MNKIVIIVAIGVLILVLMLLAIKSSQTTTTPDSTPTNPESSSARPSISVFASSSPLTECKPTGCSNEICSDKPLITICIYKPEYACYKSARCERQENDQCGWTQTEELKQCLENNRK